MATSFEDLFTQDKIIAIPAVLSEDEISQAENIWKGNTRYADEKILEKIDEAVPNCTTRCPEVSMTVRNHCNNGKNFQAGEITEAVAVASIAKKMKLVLSSNVDSKARSTYTDGTSTIIRYGSPDECDFSVTDGVQNYRCEVKMGYARVGEADVFYDSKNPLFFRKARKKTARECQQIVSPVLEAFVKQKLNIHDLFTGGDGHNLQFSEFLTDEQAQEIGKNYFAVKSVDFVATVSCDKVIISPVALVGKIATFGDGEIRPVGKNRRPFLTMIMPIR